jgi:hypothetical protein
MMESIPSADEYPDLTLSNSLETEIPFTYNMPTTSELHQQKSQTSTCSLQNQTVTFPVDNNIKETSAPNLRVSEAALVPWFMVSVYAT